MVSYICKYTGESFLFVGGQCSWVAKVFPALWGRNLVGCVTGKILVNNDCIKVRGDVNSWTRVIHESHENWSPTNGDDSTVHARV